MAKISKKDSNGPGDSAQANSVTSMSIRSTCLAVLVVQTSIHVLCLRYTRTQYKDEPVYLASTAVLLSEILKMAICFLILLNNSNWNLNLFLLTLHKEVYNNWRDGLKLLLPAGLYVIQNSLLYVALSNLDAATYQVTYQLKILTTAIFSVMMLGRKLNNLKWFSLLLLMVGVVVVQLSKTNLLTDGAVHSTSSHIIGVLSVLCACVISGFAGVYFEKILKECHTSLWMRNLQLAFFSIIIGTISVFFNDWKAIRTLSFFQGYNSLVVYSIFSQGLGGLLIGAVVKYADSILKGFATSLSIVLSSVLSYYIFNDFQPSILFVVGSSLVLLATYMYSLPK